MARTLIRGETQVMEGSVYDSQLAPIDAGVYDGIQLNKIKDWADIVLSDGSAVNGDINMGANTITNVAPAVASSDVVIKSQLDAVTAGLDPKDSVRVATTANITLSLVQTIDGVSLSALDRVLVKDQTDLTENGLYDVQAGAWTRTEDADGNPLGEVSGGMYTFVEEGTTNADTGWVVTSDGDLVPGTDDIEFTQFSGGTTVTAGAGITLTGTVVSADVDNTSIINNSGGNSLAVKAGGITDTELATDSVTAIKVVDGTLTGIKLDSAVAGSGLTQNGTTHALDVDVDNTTITIGASGLQANASAISADLAGAGLIVGAGGVLDVDVDGTTIEIVGDTLNVVDDGIGTTQLAADSVDKTIINADVAGPGLVQAVGGELEINVDHSTLEIDTDVVIVKAAGITEVEIASSALGTGLTGGSGTTIAVDDTVFLSAANYVVRDTQYATSNGQTIVTLANTPVAGTEMIFVNGVLMEEGGSDDYTISGATVTFNFGLKFVSGNDDKTDRVSATYFK